MDNEPVPFLLVTANVGSVFEDPSRLLKTWINEFLNKVTLLKPQFIALHLQEVGGKTYEKSMEYVQDFIKILSESSELEGFNRIRVYLDEDYTSAEHFTALGNLYFVAKSIQSIKIWNFLTNEWESVEGKNIHTGNIEAVPTKEKSKFPQAFFPECKWSRKGFLRTRWEIKGTVVDMINIHLFHDASNLAACEENPSVYCKSRRRALVHTLERFHKDSINGMAPYFVFGDFNFRCDTAGVIKKLTEDLSVHRIMNVKNDYTKVQYRNLDGNNILTVGKKEFTHADHQTKFKESWLQQFDRELDPLKEVLVEYPITFPPTYPYEEEPSMPQRYMSTRCPAWCDRILMNPSAKDLIVDDNFSSLDYNIIGDDVCMGDHKPVYLNIRLKVFKGTIRCSCEHAKDQQQHYKDAYCSIANATCLYTSAKAYIVLLECLKLSRIYQNPLPIDVAVPIIPPVIPFINHTAKPKISINVTDTENVNVCMCALYGSVDKVYVEQPTIDGRICTQCQYIIKQQPTEHRKTLISKRVELANDIIVNRVDTHFLSLHTFPSKYPDPYTPESIDSHSPTPEILEFEVTEPNLEINQNIIDVDDLPNKHIIQTTSKSVSPRQLKSRLKNLQQPSKKNTTSHSDDDTKTTGCFKGYCKIM